MCVKLATQYFSASQAKAVKYFRLLGMLEFSDSKAFEDFLLVNDMFDILNYKCPIGRCIKSPINVTNLQDKTTVLFNAKETFLSLKTDYRKRLCDTPHRMYMVGFIMDIECLISLSKDLLVSNSPIKYLLAYKFSQNHLKLFFLAIRQSMRCNNNPNAMQLSFV